MKTKQAPYPEKLTKREQIVRAAYKLFSENGFYATGVDAIMREANVSKRTMYVHFPTKNDLIVATLDFYRDSYTQKFAALVNRNDLNGREKILAFFEQTNDWFNNTHFHGCLAVNAMGEFAGKDTAIEQACQAFKNQVLNILRDLTKSTAVEPAEDLALKLFILFEGLISVAQVMRQACPVDVRQLVSNMIDQSQCA